MRVASYLMILSLALPATLALADSKAKCNDIDDKDLRKACQKNDYDDVNCSEFDNDSMRRECRERKADGNGGNGGDIRNVDCRKIDDDDLREKCREEKYD